MLIIYEKIKNCFKRKTDWEKEFDTLYVHTLELEEQLRQATKLANKALDIVEKQIK